MPRRRKPDTTGPRRQPPGAQGVLTNPGTLCGGCRKPLRGTGYLVTRRKFEEPVCADCLAGATTPAAPDVPCPRCGKPTRIGRLAQTTRTPDGHETTRLGDPCHVCDDCNIIGEPQASAEPDDQIEPARTRGADRGRPLVEAPSFADGTPLWHRSRLAEVLPKGRLAATLKRGGIETLGDLDAILSLGLPPPHFQPYDESDLLRNLAAWWAEHMHGYQPPGWLD